MVFKQEVNIPLALTIGLISGLLLLIMTFGVQAWYATAEQAESNLKALDGAQSDFVQLKQQEQTEIDSVRWCPQTSGATVTIPIARAMQIMVDTQGNFPSTQPTGGPATEPATTPATATAPATAPSTVPATEPSTAPAVR